VDRVKSSISRPLKAHGRDAGDASRVCLSRSGPALAEQDWIKGAEVKVVRVRARRLSRPTTAIQEFTFRQRRGNNVYPTGVRCRH